MSDDRLTQKNARSRSPARSHHSSSNLNVSRAGSVGGYGQGDSKDIYISQLVREIKELKLNDHDYTNIAGTVANLEKRLSQLRADKSQSELTNQRKHDEMVDRLAGFRTKIDEYKGRIGEREIDCKNLAEDIEAAQRTHIIKKQNIEQLSFDHDDLLNKKSQLETDLVSLKNLHARVSSEREESVAQVQLGNRRYDELFGVEKTLEADIEELEARIEGKKKSIDRLNAEVGEAERNSEDLRAAVQERDVEASDLEKVIISLNSKIDNERRSRDLEKDELDMVNSEYARLLSLINDLQLTLQKAQGKLRNKEKKLEEKKHETSILESKHDTIKSRNEEIEEQIESCRNTIEKTISQCKEVGRVLPSKLGKSKRSARVMRRSGRG